MSPHENIIEDLRNGKNDALPRLYKDYRREFLAWSYTQFKLSEEEGTEAFQFAVVQFYENVVSGKLVQLTSSVKTYLFAIGKNKALAYLRKKNRLTELEQAEELEAEIPETQDPEEMQQMVARANRSLTKLGEPCSKILILFYYQQRTLMDIATHMGYKNTLTLKSQKHKCMERLRGIYFKRTAID